MTNLATVGSLVWFDNNLGYLLPGKLVSILGKNVKVQAEQDGQLHMLHGSAVRPRSEMGLHGVEDMIKMDDLHEGSILYNIRKRYRQDHIYTNIGSILVSVNPYMQYGIYGQDTVLKYKGKSLGSKPPHIFAIGNASYQTMLRTEQNQVVVISGESGAGKTESTKQLVEFLAAINQTNGNTITQQVVEATPLLESFGNAKTVKNDNSSRFGKYLEIFYDSNGRIAGGRVSEYLLERSRIVGQNVDERNYHIFYEMLCGLPAKTRQELHLATPESFTYLKQGKCTVIPNRNEQFYYQQVVLAMDTLGIPAKERDEIFKVLAAILHIGNIEFRRTESNGQEAALVVNESPIQAVSELLELTTLDLVEALTHKKTEAGGSKVMTPRTVDQAVDARDALAKEVYSHLFEWLINKINMSIFKGKQQSSIAVLDIFGFEDFERNSFEQLCINFANETLQFFFNQFVFRMEQDEYASERITWTDIPFLDNQPRLDLLAKPPYGLIHILADSTTFPQASDKTFLEKCHQHHQQNRFYGKPKTPKPVFAVNHYAGPVWYQVDGFLEKNRDGLKPDLEELITSSKNTFVQSMFPELQSEELVIGGLKLPAQPKNSLRLPLNQKKKATVCGKFNDSLIRLVVAMKRCNPYFVRCIKPNNSKAPGKFEIRLVMEQLKYCGILETVKIRKAGFPVRYTFADFVKRYRCLSSHLNLTSTIPQENCSRILNVVDGIDRSSYQYGKTKVFLKEKVHEDLEEARIAKLNRMAVVIQARMRGYIVNSQYLKMKKAAIVIQSNNRRFQERRKYLKARKGFILLQAIYRMKLQRRTYHRLLSERQAKTTEAAPPPQVPAEETVVVRSPPEIVEVEKQPVTDVTFLEIPADLALVFANIQGWSVTHGTSVHEQKGDVIKKDYAVTSLPKDINEFPFSKFAHDHFKDEHQWRMLRTPPRNSLLNIKYSDNVQAVGLFQLVMRFMEDESITGAQEFAVGNYFVQMGIFKPGLREELYCQLCNQTWGNTSDKSNERGWLLLTLLLCCFAPSSRLYNHLLKYVSDHAYNGYKSHCQHKLLCWDMNESTMSRSHPPSVLEWEAAKSRANMAVECHCLDGERRIVEVESCTSGEDLASALLNDRSVEDSRGWSVDLEGSDVHCSLSGKDYVLDLISEMEYPPAFPLSQSPSLMTLKPGHNLQESQLKTLSNLHKSQVRGKNVAEIAYKFSFVDRPRAASASRSMQYQKEDALSAATTARLTATSLRAPVEDKLVQRSHTDGVPAPPTVPAPPAPPPATFFVPPPPPPPPPIVPPSEHVILKRRVTKKEKKKKDGGPQLSMTEVVAKAQKMREKRERVLSTSSSTSGNQDENANQFETAMQARVVELKSRRVEVQQGPRQEEENELKKEMERKAKRASRAFVDNECVVLEVNKTPSNGEMFTFNEADVNENTRRSSRTSSAFHENDRQPQSPAEFSEFVDSLFDPVLSHSVDDLTNETALQGALKGGGGVNQPGANSDAVSSAPSAGSLAGTPSVNGSGTGSVLPQGNGFPPLLQANGFPGMVPAPLYYGIPQANGPIMGVPQAHGGVDPAVLASQQQILIERLIAQQALLQQQQNVASQKQQEQLMLLAQQQQAQLEQMRLMLAASQASGLAQQKTIEAAIQEQPTLALQQNGSLTVSNGSAPLVTTVNVNGDASGHTSTGISVIDRNGAPSPPPEFSDTVRDTSTTKLPVPIPVRTSSLPFQPPPPLDVSTDTPKPPRPLSDSFPPPPPPILDSPDPPSESAESPSRPGLKRRSTDKVAIAVAALEAKSGADDSPSPPTSPVKRESFSLSLQSPTRLDSSASTSERPQINKRSSSVPSVAVLSDKKDTVLHPKNDGPYLTYNRVKWKLNLRKEVFMADEKMDNKLAQRLIFLQIVKDSYSNCCCRMSKDDCRRMQLLLQKYGITPERPHSSVPVEGIIIEAARQLPIYFSRFFIVKGQNELPDMHYLAVSEHGVKMLKREKITDELEIVRYIPYTEVVKVKAVKDKLTLTLPKEAKVIVHADRAVAIKQLINTYLTHLEKEAKYVRALYDHVSPQPSLLNFKKGDVIQIVNKEGLEDGWLYGIFNNHGGYLPADYVTHIQEDPQAVRPSNLVKAASLGNLISPEPQPTDSRSRAGSVKSTRSDKSDYNSDKYSMMEFAMHHFRHGKETLVRGNDGTVRGTVKVRGSVNRAPKAKDKKGKAEWTWRGLAELVKYSEVPIQVSLLKLEPNTLNKLAVDSFTAIMKFMGDQPLFKHQKETDLVFNLLKVCRDFPEMRDEVYCQLIKQLTSNKSQFSESASRGWRLLIIITAYIQSTDVLKPYLIKFLQSTASDPKREFHGAAATCEMNLMKTFKYGGRKTPPSPMELSQLVQGRQTKRQVFVLPGGVTRMLKVQTSSTAYDVIKEICNDMDLKSEDNYMEYGLFTHIESQNVLVVVQTSDYVMDVIASLERQEIAFSLYFRRVLWLQPLRLDNELLVNVMFNQVMPDYMAGYLLATHGRSFSDAQFQNQIAELGALHHRARNEAASNPNLNEVESLIPRGIFDRLRPQQWMILLQDHFRSCHSFTTVQSRKKFLEIVTKWPYFGSTFYEIKKCSNPAVAGDCILAVNRTGVHFLGVQTKQTLLSEPYVNIISTRVLVSDKKRQFLDLKMGNRMVQKVTRMETQEAKDIANVIFKYVSKYASEMNEEQGLASVLRNPPVTH